MKAASLFNDLNF